MSGRTAQMLMVTAMLLIGATNRAGAQSAIDDIFKLIPADAQAAIVVPNLKYLSDQVTQTLEGMDRANLLLGSRPIDQLKSMTGFNVGVDDAGSFAVVWPGSATLDQPTPLLIVPINSSDDFLKGNFKGHDGEAYTMANGAVVHARTVGSHVVLALSADALANMQTGNGVGPSLKAALGERGAALLGKGEILMFGRRQAFANTLAAAKAQAARTGVLLPGIAMAGFSLFENLDAGLTVLDFDPLGLVIRSMSRMTPRSDLHAALRDGIGGGGGLSHLPNKPFYLAASLDFAGIGGPIAVTHCAKMLRLPEPPAWLAQAKSVQFAAYPSPLGMQGGILNDSVLVLRTAQPAAAREFFKSQILSMDKIADGVTRQVKWEDNRKVNDAIGTADAYEVKLTNIPQEQLQRQAIFNMTFGTVGWRGFVKPFDDGLLMTFSQRPAVLEAVLQSINVDAKDKATGLAAAPPIKAMRAWLAPSADVEIYLGVGQIGQLVKRITAAFGVADVMKLPEIEENLPPVGFAADVTDGGIETTIVIPSGVLALMFDQASAVMNMREPAPAPATAPAAPQNNPQ